MQIQYKIGILGFVFLTTPLAFAGGAGEVYHDMVCGSQSLGVHTTIVTEGHEQIVIGTFAEIHVEGKAAENAAVTAVDDEHLVIETSPGHDSNTKVTLIANPTTSELLRMSIEDASGLRSA